MILLFSAINTEINLDTQAVIIDGIDHKVRPKTFQLLQTLIEANGELVSKAALLDKVWDDVVVDEQVIFQSIKELRKLFPGQTVIKTVPRKGYAWLPKASEQTIEQPVATKKPLKTYLLAAFIIIPLLILLVASRNWLEPKPELVSGSIVVLPVQSDIPVNDHDWVRYGVMDQVISRLTSSAQAGVLQTDYVLDVITRAKLSMYEIAKGNVKPIFDVSGAELILAMRLTGNPKDYQIVYTLYQRQGIEKGVVLDDSVQDAADQVARVIGNRITPNFELSQTAYQSSFASRLIAEALEAKSTGNRAEALKLLEAANATDSQNLVAARLLVQTLVENGASFAQVQKVGLPALKLAQEQASEVDQIRLGFWLAVSKSIHGDATKAIQQFDQVEAIAKSINDWLYLAYIEEIRGQYYQRTANYSEAKNRFQQAMEYHGILHCPLGQSNTLMHMSRLANAQDNQALAIEHAKKALDLIKTRNLSTKQPAAQQWLVQLTAKPIETKP